MCFLKSPLKKDILLEIILEIYQDYTRTPIQTGVILLASELNIKANYQKNKERKLALFLHNYSLSMIKIALRFVPSKAQSIRKRSQCTKEIVGCATGS